MATEKPNLISEITTPNSYGGTTAFSKEQIEFLKNLLSHQNPSSNPTLPTISLEQALLLNIGDLPMALSTQMQKTALG